MTAEIIRPAFTWADKAAAEIRTLIENAPDDRRQRAIAMRRAAELRAELRSEFARRNGWRVTGKEFNPGQLARGSNLTTRAEDRDHRWRSDPVLDHMTYMREPGWHGRPVAIVSQPYNHVTHDLIDDFCNAWGLGCRIGGFPSWYFPGKTLLLVFTRMPTDGDQS